MEKFKGGEMDGGRMVVGSTTFIHHFVDPITITTRHLQQEPLYVVMTAKWSFHYDGGHRCWEWWGSGFVDQIGHIRPLNPNPSLNTSLPFIPTLKLDI